MRSCEPKGWRKQQKRLQQHSPRACTASAMLQLCNGHRPGRGEGPGGSQGLPIPSLHTANKRFISQTESSTSLALLWAHTPPRDTNLIHISHRHTTLVPESIRTCISEFMLSGMTSDVACNLLGQSYLSHLFGLIGV